MADDWLLPALAGVVSLAFAGTVGWHYAARRRPHRLAWTLGFLAYAVASFVEAQVAAQGWSLPLYRAYVPLAVAPVALLGAGTVYLLWPGRAAHAFAAAMALLVLASAAGALAVPLADADLAGQGLDLGVKALPRASVARVSFAVVNAVGGLALVGGALWSWWRTRRPGLLLLGLGALLAALGGTLSALLGLPDRVALQFLAVALMFAGYLRTREAPVVSAAAA
ncbi:MAG TPA: hypothetical protein VHH36_05075 [Candidatus Thermoplasmatota archaeon]|nr:hypothetical protein [Candidatus Thermoplasmatota archaeon]